MSTMYTVENTHTFDTLFSKCCGVYTELNIVNHTHMDISIINHDGSRQTLPRHVRMYQNTSNELILEKRHVVGPIVPDKNGVIIPKLPGLRVRVNGDLLEEQGDVYVKEFNIVLAANDYSNVVKHPYQCLDYNSVLDKSIEEAHKVINDSLLISVTASDPSGKLTNLYTGFGDDIINIPVQHDILSSRTTPTMSYVFKANGITSRVYTIDISSLHGNEDVLEISNGLFPFLSKTDKDLDKYFLNYKTYGAKAVQSKMDTLKQEYDDKAAKEKQAHDLEKMLLANQLARLKDKLTAKEHELETTKSKCASLEGLLASAESQLERNMRLSIMDNNKSISNNKLKIESIKQTSAKRESDFKAWHMIVGIVVPIVTACFGIYMKK